MSEACTHDCSTCGASCPSRESESLLAPLHEMSTVRRVVGVMSGKGGVGKSLVTSLLAVLANRDGMKTAILDADITGPSIPRAFGIRQKATGSEEGLYPVSSKTGIQVMSLNLLVEEDTDPVVWRGPVIAGAVKQFWTDVIWNDVDVMFIDMPPGTGDVPLTLFQSLPIDALVVVTSPQQVVGMIVEKAIRMSEMLDIPVIALVENMSYVQCPDCGEKIFPYGLSRVAELAGKYQVELVARLPIEGKLSAACDEGMIELFEGDWLDTVYARIAALPAREEKLQ